MNKHLVYGVYFMSLEKKIINLGEFTVLGVQKSIASYNNCNVAVLFILLFFLYTLWLRTMVKIELFLPSKYIHTYMNFI